MPLRKVKTDFSQFDEFRRDIRKGVHKASSDLEKASARKSTPLALLWGVMSEITKLEGAEEIYIGLGTNREKSR